MKLHTGIERKASSQVVRGHEIKALPMILLSRQKLRRRFQTVYRKWNGSLLLSGAAKSNFAIECPRRMLHVCHESSLTSSITHRVDAESFPWQCQERTWKK